MSSAKRFWVIANPAAQGGRVGRARGTITRELQTALRDCEIHWTETPDDAARLAQSGLHSGADAVVSLGGDGTHGAVAHGLMAGDASKIGFGILPAGTGGDFKRLLGGNGALIESAERLRSATASLVDVGRVQFLDAQKRLVSRHFLNIASCGLGGVVDQYAATTTRRFGGSVTFALATAKAMLRWRAATVSITVDGRMCFRGAIMIVAVCNGQFAGGGMHFAPGAKLADGCLDVVVIEPAGMLTSLLQAPDLYRGRHIERDRVHVFRGRTVQVAVDEGTAPMDIDGEAPGFAPAEFTVVPRALRVLDVRREHL